MDSVSETHYDEWITNLARRLRLYLQRNILKGQNHWMRHIPREVGLPMVLRVAGTGSIVTTEVWDTIMRPNMLYWMNRENLIRALNDQPVYGFDHKAGWGNTAMTEVVKVTSELVEVMFEQMRRFEGEWERIEQRDEFKDDVYDDDGGLSDGEEPVMSEM